jgi:cathepsin L
MDLIFFISSQKLKLFDKIYQLSYNQPTSTLHLITHLFHNIHTFLTMKALIITLLLNVALYNALAFTPVSNSKKLVSLSEQQLVDCDKGDNGCNGGIMTSAYEYVIRNGGLDSETCYPYEARDDTCRFDKSCVSATISSYGSVPSNNDKAMVETLARQPISIAIYAAGSTFQHYNGGVYDDPTCYSDESHLDHGVLLVGYGTTDDGKDYYILKNSWDTTWGENGYMRIARGENKNICGLLDMPCYPVV